MADPSSSAHTPMAQWLRPSNVAFVLGGIVGIVALASDLPSRVVKGLGIASAAVSMLFGVYDRTRSERLTWPALWVMLWEPCYSELVVMAADARSAYRFAMRDTLVGAVHHSRTFYFKYLGIHRATISVPLIVDSEGWQVGPLLAQLGPCCVQWSAMLGYTFERLPLGETTVIGIITYSLVLGLVVTGDVLLVTFGSAMDVSALVALFAILRLCGRMVRHLRFMGTVYRNSQETCDRAAQVVRIVQSSHTMKAWRCIVPVCPFVILLILGMGTVTGIDFDLEFVVRYLVIPSILSMPAPLGFLIVVVVWLVCFIEITLVRVWYTNAELAVSDISPVV